MCVKMCPATGCDERDDKIEEEKRTAHFQVGHQRIQAAGLVTDESAKQLQVFENGTEREDHQWMKDSSDEEEDSQSVGNMISSSWESIPFPITVDYGACASVMPTTWCDHVSLRDPAVTSR